MQLIFELNEIKKNLDLKNLYNDKYSDYYNHIVSHFRNFDLNEKDLIIGFHIVYGWMPRILPDNIIDYLKLIDSILYYDLKYEGKHDWDKFSKKISWIATSKLLHFINPEIYPIWDSNVAINFNFKNYYQINNQKIYFDYIKWMRKNKVSFDIFNIYKKEGITNMRFNEFILFKHGILIKNSIKK